MHTSDESHGRLQKFPLTRKENIAHKPTQITIGWSVSVRQDHLADPPGNYSKAHGKQGLVTANMLSLRANHDWQIL